MAFSAILLEIVKLNPRISGTAYEREKATFSTEYKFEENLFEEGKGGSIEYKDGVYTYTYRAPKDFIAGKIVPTFEGDPQPLGYPCTKALLDEFKQCRSNYQKYRDFVADNQIPLFERTPDSRKNQRNNNIKRIHRYCNRNAGRYKNGYFIYKP